MPDFTEVEATQIAKALGDPIRLLTYGEIAVQKEICAGGLKVCEIVSHATVSHHLRILAANPCPRITVRWTLP